MEITNAKRSRLAAGVAIAGLLFTSYLPFARGADDEASRNLAQALFDDGVALMNEGHCDADVVRPDARPTCRAALEKFEKALAIYPGALGALRNAAFCERGLDATASALRDFREVARRAPLDPNPSKQLWTQHAQQEAERLSKLVPHLTIVASSLPEGARITLDGSPIALAAIGAPLPVDPGDHVVEARAAGRLDFSKTVTLEDREDAQVAVVLAAPPPAVIAPPPHRTSVLPALVLATGVVAIGVGVGVGFAARAARNDACDADTTPLRCHDAAQLDHSRHLANASTIVIGAGGAIALTGALWWALAGGAHDEASAASIEVAPLVSTSSAGFAVAGAF